MGYLNPIESYGYEAFARDAASSGVDGCIVVDCPPEEAGTLSDALDAARVSLIRLATPTCEPTPHDDESSGEMVSPFPTPAVDEVSPSPTPVDEVSGANVTPQAPVPEVCLS